MPPSIASPASSPASIQQKLDHPFYVSLLGSHEFSMETLQPFIQGLKEGGISAVTRVNFATSVQTHSWTLFLPGGTRLTWATSRSIIEHVSSAKRLELEGLLSALLHNMSSLPHHRKQLHPILPKQKSNLSVTQSEIY
jgi:hypothetical protein